MSPDLFGWRRRWYIGACRGRLIGSYELGGDPAAAILKFQKTHVRHDDIGVVVDQRVSHPLGTLPGYTNARCAEQHRPQADRASTMVMRMTMIPGSFEPRPRHGGAAERPAVAPGSASGRPVRVRPQPAQPGHEPAAWLKLTIFAATLLGVTWLAMFVKSMAR
jgi:hypothetical protein